jgi:hypothetical protein
MKHKVSWCYGIWTYVTYVAVLTAFVGTIWSVMGRHSLRITHESGYAHMWGMLILSSGAFGIISTWALVILYIRHAINASKHMDINVGMWIVLLVFLNIYVIGYYYHKYVCMDISDNMAKKDVV